MFTVLVGERGLARGSTSCRPWHSLQVGAYGSPLAAALPWKLATWSACSWLWQEPQSTIAPSGSPLEWAMSSAARSMWHATQSSPL